MILPIFEIFPDKIDIFDTLGDYESNIVDYDEIYNNFWNAEDERMAAQTLRSGLSEQLEMSPEWFFVELCVSRDEQGRVLEGVRLYITDAKALAANPEIIRSYFLGTVGVDCEIVYDLSAE